MRTAKSYTVHWGDGKTRRFPIRQQNEMLKFCDELDNQGVAFRLTTQWTGR